MSLMYHAEAAAIRCRTYLGLVNIPCRAYCFQYHGGAVTIRRVGDQIFRVVCLCAISRLGESELVTVGSVGEAIDGA